MNEPIRTITFDNIVMILRVQNAQGSMGFTTSTKHKPSKSQMFWSKHKEGMTQLASHTFVVMKPPLISEALFPRFPKDFGSLEKYLKPNRDTWLYQYPDLINLHRIQYLIGEGYCRGKRGSIYGSRDFARHILKFIRRKEDRRDTCSEHNAYVARREFLVPFLPPGIHKEDASPSRERTWITSGEAKALGWKEILNWDGENLTLYGTVYKIAA